MELGVHIKKMPADKDHLYYVVLNNEHSIYFSNGSAIAAVLGLTISEYVEILHSYNCIHINSGDLMFPNETDVINFVKEIVEPRLVMNALKI